MEAGTRLGPYEVVSRIGAGGMGEVWRARDTRLGREVAVKLLPAEFAADAQLRIRFEREARTISHLTHPNICTLFDVGDDYIVMELLDGEPLSQRIHRGPLPLSDVVRYGVQIAEALARAHREGVVHRDVKPGNVMLTGSGAKLLDFGLAKATSSAPSPESATHQMQLTGEGRIIGTFQYMAPEQITGGEADARTDIFALGAVLYEMATGQHAFQGSTRASLVSAIIGSDPPPLERFLPVAPPALDHVIRKCLEKDPENRWQSAQDVAEELKWIGGGSGASFPLQRPRRTRMWFWIAACAALVVAIAGATDWFIRTRFGRGVTNISFTIPAAAEQYDRSFEPWISPDGKRIAFTAIDRSGTMAIWVRSLDRLDSARLEGTNGGRWPFWSADSKAVFFGRGSKLFRAPVAGGPVQELAPWPITENFGAASNAAGVILFSTGSTGLQRLDPGGTPREFTKLDPAKHQIGHVFPTFLPDGNRFLFLALVRNPNAPDDTQHLYAGSLDSDRTTFIGKIPCRVQYDRSGYLLTVREASLVAIPFDVRRLRMHGDEVSIAFPVSWFRAPGRAIFSLANNGTVIFSTWPKEGPLQWFSKEGTLRHAFTDRELNSNGSPRLSPDGRSIIIANFDPKSGCSDLWLWGLDSETQTRLTFDVRVKAGPVFSADGRRVYFGSDVAGFPDVYETVIGEPESRFVVGGPGYQVPLDVSPDGQFLLYRSSENSPALVLKVIRLGVPDARPAPFVVTPARATAGRFSPDGRWVGYLSNETGRREAYVKPFPGPGAARQITSGGAEAVRWSGDGRRVYFGRDSRSIHFVDLEKALSGNLTPQKFIDFPADIDEFELLRDGSYLVQLDNGTYAATNVITNWTRLLPR